MTSPSSDLRPTAVTRQEVEDLLYHEAALIDAWRMDEWVELWTEDAQYIVPTNDNPDEGDLDGHFEYFVGSSTAAAVSGFADITVPAGYDAGLPIGITFIGGRWAEPKLIGFAYDYEQGTHVRVPPQFIPTIGDALFPGAPNPLLAHASRQQATQGQRHVIGRFR